jgi:hypothetical protein
MPDNPLPAQLASQAEFIVNTLTETVYQYVEDIDVENGVYNCDCNSFVGFVLEGLAPDHYALIPCEDARPRPRAFEYYDFFASLTPESTGGWHRIDLLSDARRGDILAWRFAEIVAGRDTGHVVFVAGTPKLDDSGNFFAVRVYDSADVPHFEESRGDGTVDSPSGVGTGFINFQVDAEGRPVAFQFGPPADFVSTTIAIGRVEPFLAIPIQSRSGETAAIQPNP